MRIFWGRDHCRMLDFNLLIGWDENKEAEEGYNRFNKFIEIYGNWTPSLHWRPVIYTPLDWNEIDSTRWTGREYELVKWSWPIGFNFYNGRR